MTATSRIQVTSGSVVSHSSVRPVTMAMVLKFVVEQGGGAWSNFPELELSPDHKNREKV